MPRSSGFPGTRLGALPAERAAVLPLGPADPGSQAGAGVGSHSGMLNIKQAKPGASGPEPLEPLSRALEEVLLFTGQGGGGGEEERGNAVCKIPPLSQASGPRVLGGGGEGGTQQRRLDLEANCAAATVGKPWALPGMSAPRASSEG